MVTDYLARLDAYDLQSIAQQVIDSRKTAPDHRELQVYVWMGAANHTLSVNGAYSNQTFEDLKSRLGNSIDHSTHINELRAQLARGGISVQEAAFKIELKEREGQLKQCHDEIRELLAKVVTKIE